MTTEKKPRDPRVTLCESSPAMQAAYYEAADKPRDNVVLRLDELTPGMSLVIPLDVVHEPSLRVRVSRMNRPDLGKIYRVIKHGAPHWCFEVGCLHVGNAEVPPAPTPAPVPRETTEPVTLPPPDENS